MYKNTVLLVAAYEWLLYAEIYAGISLFLSLQNHFPHRYRTRAYLGAISTQETTLLNERHQSHRLNIVAGGEATSGSRDSAWADP